MLTRTTWKSGQQFHSTYKNASIEIDGANGFSPKALLLSGLASCAGVDVVLLLEKMRIPFGAFEIDVETSQTEEYPKVFKDIRMIFRLKTGIENLDKVKKSIDLALEKYCGVAAMLKKNSSITYTIDLLPE